MPVPTRLQVAQAGQPALPFRSVGCQVHAGGERQSRSASHPPVVHMAMRAAPGSNPVVAATQRAHCTSDVSTELWVILARSRSAREHAGAMRTGSGKVERPGGSWIHPAHAGAPCQVTTRECGPSRDVTGPAAKSSPSSHACSSVSGGTESVAVWGCSIDPVSPSPATRPPSSVSALAQARSASSRSAGFMRRHCAERARSTSAMSQAAFGSSAWASSSPCAESSARSTSFSSRAADAS